MAKNDSLPPPASLAWMHAIDAQPAARSQPGTPADAMKQTRAGSPHSRKPEAPAAGVQTHGPRHAQGAGPSATSAPAGRMPAGGSPQAPGSAIGRFPELAPASAEAPPSAARPPGLRTWLKRLFGKPDANPEAARTAARNRPPPRIIYVITLLALGGAGALGYVLTGGAEGPIAKFFITDDAPVNEPSAILPTAAP